MKSAHGPHTQKTLRARGRETAQSRKRPAAHSSSDRASRASPHAARDEKWSTGPLVLGASRAPGRNLGLGWESLFPPGLNLSPVSVSRSSQSNGCAKFSAEQNRPRRPRANPSLILSLLRSLSRAAASDSERPTSGAGESAPEAPP
jgi:hypothetical protein